MSEMKTDYKEGSHSDFIEYFPPKTMSIVRTYINHKWLKKNLPILDKFWKDVVHYREVGIKCHPDFKNPKRVLDLTTDQDISDFNNSECLIID